MWNVKNGNDNRGKGNSIKSFIKLGFSIAGKCEIKELQKTAILGTAHVMQYELIGKCKTFNVGNNIAVS